jgi:hypothetical protein
MPPGRKAFRAKDEIRTRDPDLGKVVLYQLSYFRMIYKHLRCLPLLLLKPVMMCFVPFGNANIVTKHSQTSFFEIKLKVYCKLLSFRTDEITSLSKPLPIR